jgi:type I restriction enzyme, S subunit
LNAKRSEKHVYNHEINKSFNHSSDNYGATIMPTDVKPGYKMTEVGVIPEDWDVKLLPDVCRFRGGKAHEKHISEFGKYICVNSKFISTEGNVRKYSTANFCCAKEDDILMVMSDLPNGKALAKAFIADKGNSYAVNQRVCSLTAYRDNPKYLFYVLNRNPYFLKFDDGVSQTHLLNHVFQKCLLPLPPTITEQQSIADALSDTDALIESLEQLITKKRQIKQGAMQELLTGKKRLPGFSGEWEVKQLGDIVDTDTENLSSNTQPSFQFNYISLEDVDHGFLRDYSEQIFSESPSRARRRLRPGDILVSTVRPNLQSHLLFTEINRDWICSTGFCVIRCRENVTYPGYIFFHFFGSYICKQVDALIAGSNYPAINSRDVRLLQIPFPSYREQTAIATILSDMDAEITALEQKLSKARQIKQGMMQELLIGRIRLV